jgi:hypothetical protein
MNRVSHELEGRGEPILGTCKISCIVARDGYVVNGFGFGAFARELAPRQAVAAVWIRR